MSSSSRVPSKQLGNGPLNGLNHPLPSNGINRPLPSSTNKYVHKQNGRTTSSSANGSMASSSESTMLERDEIQEAGASCHSYDYEVQHTKFKDRKTKPIIKLIFCKLCPPCSKDLAKVEREIARMEQAGDKELVHSIVDTTVKLLTDWGIIKSNLEDYERHKWNVYDGNIYTEFSKVAYQQFNTTVNFGRFLMFVGFSVSFCTYVLDRDVPVAANTVMEWTCQVVEEDLAKFFLSNGGWDGYSDFLEVTCRRSSHVKRQLCQHRELEAQSGSRGGAEGSSNKETSMWPGAIAASALAIGAITAFTLKQAFS